MEMREAIKAVELSDERLERSRQYLIARNKSAEAKLKLDIILASKYLKDFRGNKKNLGIDMALLMMLEQDDQNTKEVLEYYSTWVKETANYKGLEKLIEAFDGKISLYQSIMRWERDGEKR